MKDSIGLEEARSKLLADIEDMEGELLADLYGWWFGGRWEFKEDEDENGSLAKVSEEYSPRMQPAHSDFRVVGK